MKKRILTVILVMALGFSCAMPTLRTLADVNGRGNEDINFLGENYIFNRNGVNIPDPNLKKALNKALGQREDDEISKYKLSKIQELYIARSEISNLEGIQYCKDLRILDLQNNNITDISLLSNLTELRDLYINLNPVEDITPLKSLKRLRDLFVNATNIKDISSLSNLTNLKYLLMDSNKITNFESIKNLENLQVLYIGGTNIKDISVVNNLKNLEVLSINNTEVSDLTPLKSLKRLTWLRLDRNNISDISVLSELPQLQEVTLDDNKVSNISVISKLNNLKTLKLKNNNISDITPLKDLKDLESVVLSNQKITLKNKEINEKLLIKNPIKIISGNGQPKDISNQGMVNEDNTLITWNNIKNKEINELTFNFNEKVKLGEKNIEFSGKVFQPITFNPDIEDEKEEVKELEEKNSVKESEYIKAEEKRKEGQASQEAKAEEETNQQVKVEEETNQQVKVEEEVKPEEAIETTSVVKEKINPENEKIKEEDTTEVLKDETPFEGETQLYDETPIIEENKFTEEVNHKDTLIDRIDTEVLAKDEALLDYDSVNKDVVEKVLEKEVEKLSEKEEVKKTVVDKTYDLKESANNAIEVARNVNDVIENGVALNTEISQKEVQEFSTIESSEASLNTSAKKVEEKLLAESNKESSNKIAKKEKAINEATNKEKKNKNNIEIEAEEKDGSEGLLKIIFGFSAVAIAAIIGIIFTLKRKFN
ncbi:leucine-rich repeat domain-containing protein [Clostridium septicum]|uniref:Leucine-rich repeat domain-containing protein n=1 Tax=Clostridium septicum TaxID=1504 RepID=A0A9N7JJR3_CLOSE|nr:leucine-rich repeat domain-containing protein [Clostridium septicum]AYE33869.1 hypothetical protein CP523_04955 [Clostridium septicum]UEC21523.1 leucine-rich repeat domain-containing protein [Clostridium septicum]USS00430.1 leucine-rich repeat domain-containing protein [Clostridium septicum]